MPQQEVKSVAEQIIEELFNKLKKSEVYNEAIIAKLKEAAATGKLTSPKKIIDAIKLPEE